MQDSEELSEIERWDFSENCCKSMKPIGQEATYSLFLYNLMNL